LTYCAFSMLVPSQMFWLQCSRSANCAARSGRFVRTWKTCRSASAITAKTASVHVSSILRKLGAANRVEAAAIAHRAGIAPDGDTADPAG
jgi:hypothetical protein